MARQNWIQHRGEGKSPIFLEQSDHNTRRLTGPGTKGCEEFQIFEVYARAEAPEQGLPHQLDVACSRKQGASAAQPVFGQDPLVIRVQLTGNTRASGVSTDGAPSRECSVRPGDDRGVPPAGGGKLRCCCKPIPTPRHFAQSIATVRRPRCALRLQQENIEERIGCRRSRPGRPAPSPN